MLLGTMWKINQTPSKTEEARYKPERVGDKSKMRNIYIKRK